MNIVIKKVSELIPYVNNPRNNEAAVDKVASSIKEFGFKVPIIIDSKNEIVTGHTRLLASKKLGLEEVPCIIADDLTPAQIKAYRIADNKVSELSTWDEELLAIEMEELKEMEFDVSLTGFEIDEVEDWLAEDKDYDEDKDIVEQPPAVPYTKPGDIWKLGKHRVMCGSSTEAADVLKLMNGAKADLLLTDPPYNVDYVGKTKEALTIKNDKMADSNFYQFLFDFYTNAYSVMNDGAGLYIFHADTEGTNFRKALTDAGFKLAQCCIWVKNSMVMGRQDFHWQHEPCLYGWKNTAAHHWYSDRKQTTTWNFDRPSRSTEHPTMKPVPLFKYCLDNSSKVGDIILDCFGGSGTTLIAAETCGRVSYTMEFDPKYVDVIIKRYLLAAENSTEGIYLERNGVDIPFADIEREFNSERVSESADFEEELPY